MNILRVLPCLLLAVATAGVARGQSYTENPYYRPLTVEESWANGASNIIRSKGQYNLQTSQATINLEQARSAALDNKLKSAQTYFEMRNLNRQQEFGDYPQRKAVNSQKRLFRYGQEGRPQRPTRKELDPLTGRIAWPYVLQTPEFKAPREKIDSQFRMRTRQQGAIGVEGYEAIIAATNEMLALLKDNIDHIQPSDYVAAKSFVERLAYEARNPLE